MSINGREAKKASYEEHLHSDDEFTGVYHPDKDLVIVNTSNEEKIKIKVPKSAAGNAFRKDIVKIVVTKRAKKVHTPLEAKIVQIVERNLEGIIGEVVTRKGEYFAVTKGSKGLSDVRIKSQSIGNAVEGDIVILKLNAESTMENPTGHVIKVIGNKNEVGVDVKAIVQKHAVPHTFDEKIDKYVTKKIPSVVTAGSMAGRSDLRDILTITIDGEHTKDIDDAVTVRRIDNEWFELGVYIADVAEYVKEGSVLDKEAFKRGNSLYLADSVIPMLPKKLSNGICSLNEGVDRLALAVTMKIDRKGNFIGAPLIEEAVINSDYRMTYTNIQKILDGDEEISKKYSEIVPMVFEMKELARILKKRKTVKGSIEFDFPEPEFVMDSKTGVPLEVMAREKNVATGIIEEFMIKCNEAVAKFFRAIGAPFVYRVHEEPDFEKLEELEDICAELGIDFVLEGENTVKELQGMLNKVKGKPEELFINQITLRALRKAKYYAYPLGHFALALDNYCHFTSPIRRYSDLQIHRIIKEYLRNGESAKFKAYSAIVGESARQCSNCEKKAKKLEREVDQYEKCKYMEKHVGEKYEGVISGVIEKGLFVTIKGCIDGFIQIESLEGYECLPDSYKAVDKKTQNFMRLGDKVKVNVTAVNTMSYEIDLKLEKAEKAS